jgi:enamine deaminase RidA (YjgF/YER057c/UK114 family)
MQKTNFSSGTHWEPIVGYLRAIRLGDLVYVSGTKATDKEGKIVGEGNPYLQTIQIVIDASSVQRFLMNVSDRY